MDARRQHRIIYQTKIRMRAPGREESVIARIQNLSANGMFVTASDLPDAGTEVQCRLTLGGERRTLRGRVAWVRPASPSAPLKSPGAGIEFLELDKRDSELLTRLVDPTDEHRQPVDVMFRRHGRAHPLSGGRRRRRAQAGDPPAVHAPAFGGARGVQPAEPARNPRRHRRRGDPRAQPRGWGALPPHRRHDAAARQRPGHHRGRGARPGPGETTPLASTVVDPAVATPSGVGGASPRVALAPIASGRTNWGWPMPPRWSRRARPGRAPGRLDAGGAEQPE